MKTRLIAALCILCFLTAGAWAHITSPTTALPENVSLYAKPNVGAGQQCLVGALTDDDGMNQKPVAYLEATSSRFVWHATLPLPPNTYQARATHCVGTPSMLYVLVQGDTQPEQSLSQTLLEVVALNRATGAVIASEPIDAPHINAPHTAWVEDGHEHFVIQGNILVITGKYALLSNRDKPMTFSMKLAQAPIR